MPGRAPRKRSRAAVIRDVETAGRVLSTAAVMFHSALAAHGGLTATETKAMELLDRFGPLTAGDLAERAGLAPPTVTDLVTRLEKKGFARRYRDPDDGRRVLVEVDQGRVQQFAPLFADFMRSMGELYAEYTVAELETILHFLTEAARRQQAAAARLSAPDR